GIPEEKCNGKAIVPTPLPLHFSPTISKHQTQLNERRRCSMYYYEENDLKRLGEMKALAPEEFTASRSVKSRPATLRGRKFPAQNSNGVPDLHEAKAQMTQALHAGMLDGVAGLRADLRRLIAEGTNVREDTVITRLAAFQCVRAQ